MIDTDPIQGLGNGLLVIFGIPLLVWVYPKYRRLKEFLTPTCPVCGDEMRHVDGVGYICDRPGCEAYSQTRDETLETTAKEGQQ